LESGEYGVVVTTGEEKEGKVEGTWKVEEGMVWLGL
jgi:hypothetical protein